MIEINAQNLHEQQAGQLAVAQPDASTSQIINREEPMSKVWTFIGGAVAGAASIVIAALVADSWGSGESSGSETDLELEDEELEREEVVDEEALSLPEEGMKED